LDNFRDLCVEHKKDFYDRLCYVAADRSERMLLDVLRHGVLSNHPGHYRVRQVDAMEPDKALPYDAMFYHVGQNSASVAAERGAAPIGQEWDPVANGQDRSPIPKKPFRAVFLNYLLDCLPAAVLQLDGDQAKQLCVRTCLARNVKLADFTDMNLQA